LDVAREANEAMRTLIIGANGYIGSAVARRLRECGHEVAGLARNEESAGKLAAAGVRPVPGSLTDLAGLARTAAQFDAAVFAPVIPFEEEPSVLAAMLSAYEGSARPFVYTSGTGVLSIETRDGHWRQENSAEDDPYEPRHWLSMRVDTENVIRRGSERGIRSIVVRPPQVWGRGGSKQIPAIFESVAKCGAACYVGAGLNLYSHVHVDDLAELYRLAIERGVAGALYHAVAGEVNWRTIAEAVAEVMECDTRSITFEEACDLWGPMYADLFFGVSSRSRAVRSRAELGWAPTRFDVIDDIRHGSYRAAYKGVKR
jgi:nucleoside-diphosphate-sugar epimerase